MLKGHGVTRLTGSTNLLLNWEDLQNSPVGSYVDCHSLRSWWLVDKLHDQILAPKEGKYAVGSNERFGNC